MRKRAIAAIVFASVVALAVMAAPRSEIPNDPVYAMDGPATKAAVLNVVPIGSQIETAAAVMRAKGFRCVMMKNMQHAGYDPANPRRLMTYPAADFLWCDSGELWMGWRSLVVDKRWQISFVTRDGAVTAVDVGVGLTGP